MMHRAGMRPPFIQLGMELLNEHGERWRVADIYSTDGGTTCMARLVESDPPPQSHVPCLELRSRWILADDFDDGD